MGREFTAIHRSIDGGLDYVPYKKSTFFLRGSRIIPRLAFCFVLGAGYLKLRMMSNSRGRRAEAGGEGEGGANRKKNHGYIYTPNLGLEIAVSVREREHVWID